MLRVERKDRLQYGNMADNSGAEKTSSPLREIVCNKRVLWWAGGAVVLIALVAVTRLERKRIHFSSLRERFSHPPDWFMPALGWISNPPGWFMPLGLAAGALLALAILWKVPQWQVGHVKNLEPKERLDRENEARKTLATIFGGIAFLVGGFFTWQNLKVAQENLKVSQEGQITDRFSKAIEQLGAVDDKGKKKLEVRLGGIYALEGIANESKELHWPIMEVLCSYVRENAPIKRENPAGEEQKSKKLAEKNQASLPRPTADIQAILTVLGRRDRTYERKDQHLDLRQTDLRGADFAKANLSGADLFQSTLSHANLTKANLAGAFLGGAYLLLASLGGADLSGADLQEADLSDTMLIGADLRGAILVGVNFVGVFFFKPGPQRGGPPLCSQSHSRTNRCSQGRWHHKVTRQPAYAGKLEEEVGWYRFAQNDDRRQVRLLRHPASAV